LLSDEFPLLKLACDDDNIKNIINNIINDINNSNDTMNEVDFDVSRLPALRKAKPEVTAAAASSRHSQFELEGK